MRRNDTTFHGSPEVYIRTGAFIALVIYRGLVFAQDPTPSARYRIEQPSQPLSDSLRAIARQTGISLLFDPAAVNGRVSRPVSGQLSAAEAIARALEGSGLILEVMKDGTIVVRAAAAAPAASAPRSAQTSDVPGPALEGPTSEVRLAQAATQTGSDAGAGTFKQGDDEGKASRIEITGSRLKRIAAEGPQPVNIYSREDIDKSGQPTLQRFLAGLNEASSIGEGGLSGQFGLASVQLRGLPLGSTLVLINGRRVQAVGASSGNIFNLNLIPMAAVDRIEVVPVGSSAVYGGDALAGVVNVILKKSIDGVNLNVQVGSGKGTGDGNLSLATGGRGDLGSYLVLGSFSKKEPLGASERAFFKDADYRRFGGIDARSRLCIPGTVSSTTSANLPGLNSTVAGIPQTASGQALTVGNFTATAGQPNLCGSEASGSGTALVHGGQSSALHAAGDLRIGEAWSLFGELTFMRDHLRSMEGGVRLNNVLVPASNAFNPFGVPVRVTARMGLENGAEGFVRDTDYTRALVGVRGALSAGWDVEATASTSKDTGVRLSLNNTTSAPARTAALASSSPGTALNLFTTGRAASDEVLRNIWSDTVRENAGKKDQVSAFVRGPLLDLPAGSVDAIFGGEVAHDRFQILRTATDHDDRRQASAVYGELRAPLLRGDAGGGNRWNLAALTVAGRRDKYSDFGSASTYQAGIEVRPVPTVLLRASGATSFKPPTLLQTAVTDSVIPLDASIGLVDPERGNAPIASGELFRTTNHGLQPEQGKAYSVGVVWEPQASGSRVAVTAWRVNIDGLIALPSPQVTLNYESLFPGYVTRAQSVNGVPGVVTRILYQEINFGSVDTSGTDFDVSQSWQGAGGKWTLAGSATLTRKYGVVLAPGAPLQDRMGQRFQDYWAPKWKARLSAGVEAGAWGVALTGRYLGAYKDAGANPRRLGDYWVPDLSARLDLKKLGVGFDAGVKAARLSLSVVNLTNRLPEYVATFPYYDISQGDWRGRYASVRLSVDW